MSMGVTLYIVLRYRYGGGIKRSVKSDTSKLRVNTNLREVWDERGCWYELVGK